MNPDKATADLSARVAELPDDALDAFLEQFRGSFRVTLVPGYRTETIFGRPTGCRYPYVVHASGLAETNTAGQFTMNIAHLLHCIGPGAPMPGGLRSPVDTGEAVVPGSGTLTSGTPVTVVTGTGAKPALFTATADGFTNHPPSNPSLFYLGWRDSDVQLSARQKVTIMSFQPDGAVFPRAIFNWHVTLEVIVMIPIG